MVKTGSRRDLIIVIFPNGVKFLCFQYFILAFMLDILSEKLRVNIFVRSVSKIIPNILNLVTPHFNFHLVFID